MQGNDHNVGDGFTILDPPVGQFYAATDYRSVRSHDDNGLGVVQMKLSLNGLLHCSKSVSRGQFAGMMFTSENRSFARVA